MSSYFADLVSVYASSVITFLSSEPVIYFVGAFLLILIIKIIKALRF